MVRLHRILAMAIGLMLPVWFLTGTVLSFVPFPSLGGAARLAAAEPLAGPGRDLGSALRSTCLDTDDPATDRLRLVVVDGALRWIALGAGVLRACDAATGGASPPVDRGQAARIVGRFSGRAPVRVEGPIAFDAWTIHDGYRPARPFWRAVLGDEAGTQVYVSARSGEVVQRTTARERRWNSVGARLHWLNLGTLRNSFPAWRGTMLAVATLALLLVLAGLALGVRRAWQWRRARRQGLSPYRGLRRVHHVAGLGAGLLILWWLGSGWMSLDTGLLFGRETPDGAQRMAWRGMSLQGAARAFGPLDAATLGTAREIEVVAVAGVPRLVLRGAAAGVPRRLAPPAARGGDGAQDAPAALAAATRVLREAAPLEAASLVAAAQAAWSPHRVRALVPLAPDDDYALRGAPFPAGAVRLVLDDPRATWLQVDPASGELLSALDAGRRRHRWLVDGLHRLDFPVLNRAGDAWHLLLVLGTACGFAFSLSGVWLAARRLSGALRRTASRAGSAASGTGS